MLFRRPLRQIELGSTPGSSNHGVRRKIHTGIDADTLEMGTPETTSHHCIGDASVLLDLLAQTSTEERIDSDTANCIHDSKGFLNLFLMFKAVGRLPWIECAGCLTGYGRKQVLRAAPRALSTCRRN